MSEDPFKETYLAAGLPASDYDHWVRVLLAYPRDKSIQTGTPTGPDHDEAAGAAKRGDIPATHTARNAYAWQVCVSREGTSLLGRADAQEVARYLKGGGTLAEACAYVAAVTAAVTPDDQMWTVWARHELAFDAARFTLYRTQGVSPEDLGWFVFTGAFTAARAVGQVHDWRQQHCPSATWRLAALYRTVGVVDVDLHAWEDRRQAGDDVEAALELLRGLKT